MDLKRYSFFGKFELNFVYPTNHDAVCFIRKNYIHIDQFVAASTTTSSIDQLNEKTIF